MISLKEDVDMFEEGGKKMRWRKKMYIKKRKEKKKLEEEMKKKNKVKNPRVLHLPYRHAPSRSVLHNMVH